MLGSVHDADDALQETLARAARCGRFARRCVGPRVALPHRVQRLSDGTRRSTQARAAPRLRSEGSTARAARHARSRIRLARTVSQRARRSTGRPRDARGTYEQREGVELAFVVALQHLAANQRAVLLLREVLGFSAAEVATMLATSVASINSALQRARASVEQRIAARTQQSTLRALGDDGLQRLVARYVDAWERCDVDAFAALLIEDASFAMPPLSTWYAPRSAIVDWARNFSLSGAWRWRTVLCEANAQPALGFYAWDADAGAHLPFALNVLTLRDDRVSDVTAFIIRAIGAPEPDAYVRFPQRPMDPRRLNVTFERFGLPASL